jgi:chromosome segregation ATPase
VDQFSGGRSAAPQPPAAEPKAAPAARLRGAESEAKRARCARLLADAREAQLSIAKKEAEIGTLEAKLARLEASDLAYSRLDCRNDATLGDKYCSSQVFDRDREIERTGAQINRVRDELEELEIVARRAAEHDCEPR